MVVHLMYSCAYIPHMSVRLKRSRQCHGKIKRDGRIRHGNGGNKCIGYRVSNADEHVVHTQDVLLL